MLVLHAASSGGGLAVWGEVARRPASLSELRDALGRADIGVAGDARTFDAALPTVRGALLPSSPLLGDTDKAASLRPWPVEALLLDVDEVHALLTVTIGKRLLAPAVLVGADLAFFTTAMRFASALIARGHVLPTLKASRAEWTPAPDAVEHEQIASLARAVPPSALAMDVTLDGRTVLDRFLSSVVDRHMRAHPSPITHPSSLHERWVAALFSEDGIVDGDAEALAALERTISEWRRPVAEQSLFDFRVAFRLEEPDTESDPWTIRLLLQGIDDPSLILPLELVWNSARRTEDAAAVRRILRRSRGDARRFVLGSLARAAALSPAVDAVLRQPAPSEITTDAHGAFAFLATDAPALQSAGFGVFLPSWWSRRGTKTRLSLRAEARAPKFKSKGALSLQSLLDVRWRVALGGETLSMEELRALARMKVPLVRLRGQWVQLREDEIREALRFARAKAESISAADVIRMELSGSAPEAGVLEVSGVDASGPMGEILDRLEGAREWEEFPAPDGFTGTLRPYQSRGYSWMDFLSRTGLGACLADDMGLGKTVQTLALVQRQWLESKQPVLLICPTSVTGNWLREAARFTPDLPVLLHHGSDRSRGKAFATKARESAIVISSYSLLARDVETLRAVEWKGIVLDEAQNVKNSETRQARAARSLEGGFRVALTGTPVENNIGDLWSIMEFLNPGYLGTPSSFRERFFLPIQTRRDPDAIEGLRRLTGPFILRRLKTDRSIIADLPEKNEMKVYCTLTKEQASLYQAVAREAEESIAESEGISRKGLILATLTRLKQVCNHPLQLLGDGSPIDGRSGKLARLTEMLTEAVESGDRALVFTQFAEMCGILQTHLQEQLGVEAMFLHGGTPRTRRDAMVERFQSAEGAADLHPLAEGGGHGPQSHPCQSRVSLRSVVESGGGESGHRPSVPHRPDAVRAGAQVHLRRNVRGEDRRHDRGQAGVGVEDRRHG